MNNLRNGLPFYGLLFDFEGIFESSPCRIRIYSNEIRIELKNGGEVTCNFDSLAQVEFDRRIIQIAESIDMEQENILDINVINDNGEISSESVTVTSREADRIYELISRKYRSLIVRTTYYQHQIDSAREQEVVKLKMEVRKLIIILRRIADLKIKIEKIVTTIKEEKETRTLITSFLKQSPDSIFLIPQEFISIERLILATFRIDKLTSGYKANQTTSIFLEHFRLLTRIVGKKYDFQIEKEYILFTWKLICAFVNEFYACKWQNENNFAFEINFTRLDEVIEQYLNMKTINHISSINIGYLTQFAMYINVLNDSLLNNFNVVEQNVAEAIERRNVNSVTASLKDPKADVIA